MFDIIVLLLKTMLVVYKSCHYENLETLFSNLLKVFQMKNFSEFF